MFKRERISLVLAATLVASLLVILAGSGGSQSQEDKQERKLKTKDFQDMPLVVRQVRNLKSDSWHKDLEIEVKNVSTKPIYFILAYLKFPDVPVPADGVYGIALEFGKSKYIDYRKDANPQDLHLNPGDTFTFTIPENMRKGLRVRHQGSPEQMKKLEIHFSAISFGDGTGFVAEQLRDRRRKRAHPGVKKNHRGDRSPKSDSVEPPRKTDADHARAIFMIRSLKYFVTEQTNSPATAV